MENTPIASLTARIKQEAHQRGFGLVGVTTPDPPPHLDFYRRWIEAGYQGTMSWMATERALEHRADPRKILPDCESILVLGAQYPAPPTGDPGGKIAAYAGNRDYHAVLDDRLQSLASTINTWTRAPLSWRCYTDTGPILERELGVRAGLGWIGKNTCLIHPRRGSYFFLAEMFLSIPLTADPPFEGELCGSCTRCLDACPTGCIEAPYIVNAARCISYLTIEYREMVPRPLRPLIGEWIFGCDICQQVCPWNQRFWGEHPVLDEFTPMPALFPLSLPQELELSPGDFNQKFRGSPIRRAKRRGYLRNVAVVLGNQRAEKAVPALQAALNDAEPLVRGHAAWALGQIRGDQALTSLLGRAELETDAEVKLEIQKALQEFTR